MASDIELTAGEIAQFRDDGYVVLREFIPADMLAELREGYDAATRGECDVDGWNQKIARGDIMQLGMPNAHIPGWEGHSYLHLIVAVGKQLLESGPLAISRGLQECARQLRPTQSVGIHT